jgi:hypothetical protein
MANNLTSSLKEVNIGVHQGSILGPLLFLPYINDLPNASNFCSLLFADDTTLVDCDVNIDILIERTNREFKKVCEFFRANKLVLHPAKTKFILYSKTKIKEIEIFCDNNNLNQNDPNLIQPIGRVGVDCEEKSVKFLGILIDDELNFKHHLSLIRSKLSKSLFQIRKAKNFLAKESLILLYYAIFHSHLAYATIVWSSANQSLINDIFKLQKKAIRLITLSKYNAHTEPIFKKLNILPLPDLITFFQVQFVHRFIDNLLPQSFSNTWTRNNDRNIGQNAMQLRNYQSLHIPFTRTVQMSHLPFFYLPKIWNNFPDNTIKNINTKQLFDENLKQYFLNDLNETVVCDRLFCPACSQ